MSTDKTKEIEELKARLSELEASVKEENEEPADNVAPKKKAGNIAGFIVIGIVAIVLIAILTSALDSSKRARSSLREMGLNNETLDRLVMQYHDSTLTKREVIKVLQDRGYSKTSIEEAIDALW